LGAFTFHYLNTTYYSSFENIVITSKFDFFRISDIFPTCLPANTTDKNSLKNRCLLNHFFAIFKVSRHWGVTETCSLRDRHADETWNLRDETEARKNGRRVSRLHHWFKIPTPVSSELSDLRNFWLHAMCACTEKYSTYQIRWENWWL